MKFEAILFMVVITALLVKSEHLILGDADKKQLIFHTKSQYHSIPFIKRKKQVFYNSPDQSPINAIMAYDNLHSPASAIVTAGGLGHTYVNLRLESERGGALDYDIGIYS